MRWPRWDGGGRGCPAGGRPACWRRPGCWSRCRSRAPLFLHGSRTTVVAGHDAVVRPSLDGWATLDLGPYLPNVRYPTGGRLGARIDLGKTTADSYPALIQRYAFIASQPEGADPQGPGHADRPGGRQRRSTARCSGWPRPAVVLLVGRRRWGELRAAVTVRRARGRRAGGGAGASAGRRAPLGPRTTSPVEQDTWQPLRRGAARACRCPTRPGRCRSSRGW